MNSRPDRIKLLAGKRVRWRV